MLKQIHLAAAMFALGFAPALADGLPVPHKQRVVVRPKTYYAPRPLLTPSCFEKGSPLYGTEPVLVCAPQVVVAPPYDLPTSREINTIMARSRPPYDQLFAWHYGPGGLRARTAPGYPISLD